MKRFFPIFEIAEKEEETHVGKDCEGKKDVEGSIAHPQQGAVDKPCHPETQIDPKQGEEREEDRQARHKQDRGKNNEGDWDEEEYVGV